MTILRRGMIVGGIFSLIATPAPYYLFLLVKYCWGNACPRLDFLGYIMTFLGLPLVLFQFFFEQVYIPFPLRMGIEAIVLGISWFMIGFILVLITASINHMLRKGRI